MAKNYRKISFWIIGITATFAAVILLVFILKSEYLGWTYPINTPMWADYGTLVGGIATSALTIASIFLIIQTLNDQNQNFIASQKNQLQQFEQELAEQRKLYKEQANEQRKIFDQQLVENRFFELIRLHRENSNEIIIKERNGKKALLSLAREFYESLNVAKSVSARRKVKLSEMDILNIAYLCFFYGAVGDVSKAILNGHLSNYADNEHPRFVSSLINAYEKRQKDLIAFKKFDYVPFEGHQSRLGHYFRHLFQTVKYINDKPSDFMNYKQKYAYIKILRGQLSNQEQALLFFNSLSEIGKPWEMKSGLDENKKLLTKYNMFKNIPTGYLKEVDIKKYYPEIYYEGDLNKSDKRKTLEKSYT